MNIVFITCYYKTPLFLAVSKNLTKINPEVNVYWVSASRKWTGYLLDNGVLDENICQINARCRLGEEDKKEAEGILFRAEEVNKKSSSFIVQSDRVVSRWKSEESQAYLLYATKILADFFKTANVKYVFGEATALHEVLSAFISKSLGVVFLKPHTVRIPNGYFGFFEGYLEKNLLKGKGERISQGDSRVEEVASNVVNNSLKPSYFYVNEKRPRFFSLGVWKKIFNKIPEVLVEPRWNASSKTLSYHLFSENKLLIPFRLFLMKVISPFDKPCAAESYVLFTLHKQPEASIDVLGQKCSNQIELIKKISLAIPSNVRIYVKEHSNAVGERPAAFYSKIKKIPNVTLIDPCEDSHGLVKKAEAVFTVSGTIAYEALLFGIPSITFSPMFFNDNAHCVYSGCDPEEIRQSFINRKSPNKEHGFKVLREVERNSFAGNISDSITDPTCLSERNVGKVSEAFLGVIKYGR